MASIMIAKITTFIVSFTVSLCKYMKVYAKNCPLSILFCNLEGFKD